MEIEKTNVSSAGFQGVLYPAGGHLALMVRLKQRADLVAGYIRAH